MSHRILELTQRRTFGVGNIDFTLSIPRRPARSSLRLPFEVWFHSNDGAEPFLIVNPTLELKVYRRIGPSSRSSEMFELPVCTGSLSHTGGLADRRAVVWRPFAQLSTELLLALDSLRSIDHGLRVEFEIDTAVVGFGRVHGDERYSADMFADSIAWHHGFDVTPDIWRELLDAWGWPRPKLYELNPASFSDLSDFDNAVSALQLAERQLLLGHWSQAIAQARIVVEAVLRHLGFKDKNTTHWQAMEGAGLPSEMSRLIKAFNSVTSLEHHPTGNSDVWQRADARFLVQLAASLAEYAATLSPSKRMP